MPSLVNPTQPFLWCCSLSHRYIWTVAVLWLCTAKSTAGNPILVVGPDFAIVKGCFIIRTVTTQYTHAPTHQTSLPAEIFSCTCTQCATAIQNGHTIHISNCS